MMKTYEKVANILKQRYLGFSSEENINTYADSIAIVVLIDVLEKEFGIKISALEVNDDNFKDLASLVQFIDKKIEKKK